MNSQVKWVLVGLAAGIAMSLVWAGVAGGFLLLVVAGIGATILLERRISGPLGLVLGLLFAIDIFVVTLVVSPPCKYPPASYERLPDGSFRAECTPRTDLGGLALKAVVGTVAIGLLLWLWRRHRERAGLDRSTELSEPVRVRMACAGIALVVAAIAVLPVLSANHWSPAALVRMAAADPLAPYALSHDPGFPLFNRKSHYDGVYFYAIANDPLALGEPHTKLDLAAHRYSHALYGWLGWFASGGQPAAVPGALLAIGVIALVVAAPATSRLAELMGMSPWWGLAVPLNPGLIAAVSWDTSEPLAAAVTVTALIFWIKGRKVVGGLLLIALCLTRQPFAVIPLGLAAWELLQVARRQRSWKEAWPRLGLLSLGPLVALGWQTYLYGRFGVWPFETANIVLTIPFEGWAWALRLAAVEGGTEGAQIGLLSLPVLAVHLVAALFVTVRALRLQNPLAPVFLGLIFIWFSFHETAIFFPKDLLRFSAIPYLVAPFVFARLGDGEARPNPESV